MDEPCPIPCHRCIRENAMKLAGLPLDVIRMIVCDKCGNKRCPRASDHRNRCTESNEPNQIGEPMDPYTERPTAWRS